MIDKMKREKKRCTSINKINIGVYEEVVVVAVIGEAAVKSSGN